MDENNNNNNLTPTKKEINFSTNTIMFIILIISIICLSIMLVTIAATPNKVDPYTSNNTNQIMKAEIDGTTNPYKGHATIIFMIGEKFAKTVSYTGQNQTIPTSITGYAIKLNPDEQIPLPTVTPKEGLTFKGWSYGGTNVEIQPDATTATITQEQVDKETKLPKVFIYAVYEDQQGNKYCTCNAFEPATQSTQNTVSTPGTPNTTPSSRSN